VSRLALKPTHPLLQWAPGKIYAGVKQPGFEAEHSPPSSGRAIPPLSNTLLWLTAALFKRMDSLVPQLGRDRFLPNPFISITQQSSYHESLYLWRYGEEGKITKHHFSVEETTPDVHAVIHLT
jgi:hypothetical protein